jgi:hypothetical protein
MKKKGLLLLVLAALVVGGAFAQRVGDTLDAFGKKYTVKEVKDGSVLLQLTPTLNGDWKSPSGFVITINGNSAVYKQLNLSEAFYQDAAKKGYIKVGTQTFRNLNKTGDLTWSGQGIGLNFNNNAPDVCTGTRWTNCNISLSADGKTFQYYLPGASINEYSTYTRQ